MTAAITLTLCVVAWAAAVFSIQRKVLFPAPAYPTRHYFGDVPDVSVWELDTPSGKVEAWWLPPLSEGEPVAAVLYAHGNGEIVDHWPEAMTYARQRGLAYLLVEYPGYGRSEGAPSQRSIGEAMEIAYDRLREATELDPSRIFGHGRSLGGGAVCELSRRRELAGLVLESTFTSVHPLARRFIVPSLLIRDPFDNLAVVRDFERPILIVHGTRDMMIGYAHAEKLAAAAPDARLLPVPYGHNDIPYLSHEHWEPIVEFFLKNTSK